jgi:hypothetical protein
MQPSTDFRRSVRVCGAKERYTLTGLKTRNMAMIRRRDRLNSGMSLSAIASQPMYKPLSPLEAMRDDTAASHVLSNPACRRCFTT